MGSTTKESSVGGSCSKLEARVADGDTETGNMLIMLYAHARFSGDGSLLQKHVRNRYPCSSKFASNVP